MIVDPDRKEAQMTVLVFGTTLDSGSINRVAGLLGGVSVRGYVQATYSQEPVLTGDFSLRHTLKIVDALFSQTSRRSVFYTMVEAEVEESKTFPLYLVESFKYLGILNEVTAQDIDLLDSTYSKFLDHKKLREVAEDSSGYTKMPDGRRLRDVTLSEITDSVVRDQAMSKGCGKRCLSDLAKELAEQANSVPLIRRPAS